MHKVFSPATLICLLVGCSQSSHELTELYHVPLDSADEVIAGTGWTEDSKITSDGGGSLFLATEDSITVNILEIDDLDVENTRLTYRAELRTEDFSGQAYLEMWCSFESKGEYFSRDLNTPVIGNTDWTTEETYFLLRKGESPRKVRLNLVVVGHGKVWIDNIRLLKTALN